MKPIRAVARVMAFYRLPWRELAALPFPFFWQLYDQLDAVGIEAVQMQSLPIEAARHTGKWGVIDGIVDSGYIVPAPVPVAPEVMREAARKGAQVAAAVHREIRNWASRAAARRKRLTRARSVEARHG